MVGCDRIAASLRLKEPVILDVHPPHSSLHGWRDFLVHIATITIGLLIALGLENVAETVHHRHVVREARENIRQEIELNREQAKKNEASIKADADRMKANMQKARDLRADRHALDLGEMQFSFSWSSFNQSAWLSARDSGALTYMPTTEVQSYADNYEQQNLVNREAVSIFTDQIQVAIPLIMEEHASDIRPEDVQRLMRESAGVYIRLVTLNQLVEQLDGSYAKTLKQ